MTLVHIYNNYVNVRLAGLSMPLGPVWMLEDTEINLVQFNFNLSLIVKYKTFKSLNII